MFTNIPSPIRTKNSRFIGLSLICLHFVYVLTCYLPLNSHGKSKSLGFIKNISHLYEFLRGCWQPFLGGFNYRPHLIGQKDGKIPPLLKTFLTYIHEIAVLYTLFSKIFSLRLHLSSNRTKNNLILPLKRKIFCLSPICKKMGFW